MNALATRSHFLACQVASERDFVQLSLLPSPITDISLSIAMPRTVFYAQTSQNPISKSSPDHWTTSTFPIAVAKPISSSRLNFMHWCACRLSRSHYETQRKPSNSPSLQFSDSRFPQGMGPPSSFDQLSLTASHLRASSQDSHEHAAIGSVFDGYHRFCRW